MHVNAVKFWRYDRPVRKLQSFDCQLGHTKRFLTCLSIDKHDTFAYCGSRYGDVLEISIEKAVFKRTGPLNRIFQGGVSQINTKFDGYLLLANNDGSVAKIDKTSMKVIDEVQLC